MEMEHIIQLIHTVSQSALTSFKYEEGDSKLSLEINRNIVKTEATPLATTQVVMEGIKADDKKDNSFFIKSPMVGTFYAAKSEDSEPFVSVGDTVKKGQIIGIVEAMKLMNEIEAPYEGVVESILVKNKDVVEYGQHIISLKPL